MPEVAQQQPSPRRVVITDSSDDLGLDDGDELMRVSTPQVGVMRRMLLEQQQNRQKSHATDNANDLPMRGSTDRAMRRSGGGPPQLPPSAREGAPTTAARVALL